MEYWFHNILVNQLFNREGALLRMKSFWQNITSLSHLLNMPKSLVQFLLGSMLFKSQPWRNVQQVSLLSPTDALVGKVCFSSSPISNNRTITAIFQENITTLPRFISHWNLFIGNIVWKNICMHIYFAYTQESWAVEKVFETVDNSAETAKAKKLGGLATPSCTTGSRAHTHSHSYAHSVRVLMHNRTQFVKCRSSDICQKKIYFLLGWIENAFIP